MEASFSLILIVAVAAVAVFVLGMSLTLIVKGHYMKSEIGDNEEMAKRGIKCAVSQMREDDAALAGCDRPETMVCGGKSCGDCDVVH